jgi:predicted Zn-dependent protease
MKKPILQLLIIVCIFFASWFIINQVNWMQLFKVEKLNKKTEEKLGDLFWDYFKHTQKEIDRKEITAGIDSILTKICISNNIDTTLIKVHIFENSEINAFALPNNHLVIYSQLILSAENEAELSGVICHELAHLQMNHVMKKLIKEIGLSALISMTAGNSGAEIVKQAARTLSSSAYDRNLEKEADIKAVEYLVNAKIDPEPFAEFLYKMAEKDTDNLNFLVWVSTHPDSKERAEYVLEYSKEMTKEIQPILNPDTWNKMQETLNSL